MDEVASDSPESTNGAVNSNQAVQGRLSINNVSEEAEETVLWDISPLSR